MARKITLTTAIFLLVAISSYAFTWNAGRGGDLWKPVALPRRTRAPGPARTTTLIITSLPTATATTTATTTTQLHERRWNFNEGQSPWGFKRNAEIWNGRVAQMAFVGVVLQELIQGKGIIQGLQEGDPVNLALAGAALVFVVAFTAFLAWKGDDDYVTRYLEEKNYLKR